VLANTLRVSPRTVERWEQGGQVSPLAATFVELVIRYPNTIERLQTLPRRVSRLAGKARASRMDGWPLWSPGSQNRDLHPSDEDLSLGTPGPGHGTRRQRASQPKKSVPV
jgi:hypothetical protein